MSSLLYYYFVVMRGVWFCANFRLGIWLASVLSNVCNARKAGVNFSDDVISRKYFSVHLDHALADLIGYAPFTRCDFVNFSLVDKRYVHLVSGAGHNK